MKQDNKSNSINELDWNFDKLYHHDTANERATLIYRYRLFFSLLWLHSNNSSKVDENSKSWSHDNQRDGNIAAWLGSFIGCDVRRISSIVFYQSLLAIVWRFDLNTYVYAWLVIFLFRIVFIWMATIGSCLFFVRKKLVSWMNTVSSYPIPVPIIVLK